MTSRVFAYRGERNRFRFFIISHLAGNGKQTRGKSEIQYSILSFSVTLSVEERVDEFEDDCIELTELLRVLSAAAQLSELRPKGSVGGGTVNLAGRYSIVERWLRLRSGSLPTEESSESSVPSERRLLSRLARITGTSVRRT